MFMFCTVSQDQQKLIVEAVFSNLSPEDERHWETNVRTFFVACLACQPARWDLLSATGYNRLSFPWFKGPSQKKCDAIPAKEERDSF